MMHEALAEFKKETAKNQGQRATIFAYHVLDPERFGVVDLIQNSMQFQLKKSPENPNPIMPL